jgi:23S rRNA pseudouridine2605 synthase
MRLAKHLAHAGVASRRAAEGLIAEGRVTVDGVVVTDPARGVDGSEAIAVDGASVRGGGPRVVYAVHKPAGVVSTVRDTHGRRTVVELVNSAQRLYPVGRLDADTTGLILLTNDGELAYALTHPRFEVPKTYRARVDGRPDERALRALRDGVELEDGMTAPARVRRVSAHEVELTIHEGRKRQVRRMLEAVGQRVVELRRVAFGPLRLGELGEGRHRRLTAAEVERLRAAAQRPAERPVERPAPRAAQRRV